MRYRKTIMLATLALSTLLAMSCGPHQPTEAQAKTDIQTIYDRQDAGFAAKNTDDMLYHVEGNARITDMSGHTASAAKTVSEYGGLFYHGSNLHSNSQITQLTLTGKTATALVSVDQTYNLTNTTSNTEQGITEPFESKVTCQDVWTLTDGGWWQTSSKMLTDQELRNGTPYNPD